MRRIWILVQKDLRRQLRSPLGMLVMLSFPLVFSGLLALTFGGGGGPTMPRVRVLVEDRDASLISGLLLSALGSAQMAEHFDVVEVNEEGSGAIERGEASALLRIPERFGADLLAGVPTRLELIRNPAESILPEIAEQALTVMTDVLSGGSRILREPLDRLAPLLEGGEGASPEQAAEIAVAFQQAIQGGSDLLMPPAITFESVQLGGEEAGSGGASRALIFIMILPGISVWALFALGDMAMRDILTESRQGTLRRQLTTPLPARQLVLAKALYTCALAVISLVILSSIGWLVLEGRIDLPGFAVLSGALILAVTGFASIVYGLARTEQQGATISSIVLLVFAFIGGSFIQLDSLPAAVRQLSPLTPMYWGTTGYRALIQEQGGWTEILPHAGILGGGGVALLLLGAVLLERRAYRGAAA